MEENYKYLDDLHLRNEYQTIHDHLRDLGGLKPDCGDQELLWRAARSFFDMANREGVYEKSADGAAEKVKILETGLVRARAVLNLNQESGMGHKWVAILLGSVSEHRSSKVRLKDAFIIKEHAEKAGKLMPRDSTVQHFLGMWHYNVAGLGWVEKKVAKVLFGTPPESTYDNAMTHFMMADYLQPDFKENALMMVYTFNALGDKESARLWHEKASKMS